MCWWLCWCVDVLMTLCWCVDVSTCWCIVLSCWCLVDVLMCWSGDYDCVDVYMLMQMLMCRCLGHCVDVLMTLLMCWCADVLMCWCADVLMWRRFSTRIVWGETFAVLLLRRTVLINRLMFTFKHRWASNSASASVRDFWGPSTSWKSNSFVLPYQ
jgi:hypothetical protein